MSQSGSHHQFKCDILRCFYIESVIQQDTIVNQIAGITQLRKYLKNVPLEKDLKSIRIAKQHWKQNKANTKAVTDSPKSSIETVSILTPFYTNEETMR